jgi:hypothetical protein
MDKIYARRSPRLIELALFLLTLSFRAHAAPYYASHEDRPVICNDPSIAIQVAIGLRTKQNDVEVERLMKTGKCRIYAAGTRFEIIESNADYSQIKIPGVDFPKPQFIAGSANAQDGPFDSSIDKPTFPLGCEAPTGGEVQRLEAGQDGRLFLKRYLITTKCVDGEMRSFTKRLN